MKKGDACIVDIIDPATRERTGANIPAEIREVRGDSLRIKTKWPKRGGWRWIWVQRQFVTQVGVQEWGR